MGLPLVAIVGAPNVGKSTLFNRLVRKRKAIVTDERGVTRDRLYGEVVDVDPPFRLVDTGGLTPNEDAPFSAAIERQARLALGEATVILFVVDARAGLTALDREIASMLRREGRKPLLVANKIDSEKTDPAVHELHGLGFSEPLAVSAEHGRGVDLLLDAIGLALRESGSHEQAPVEAAPELRVAIVGRPNVGKSSLLNRLVGEERVMVSEVPGTTRDSIDTLLSFDGRSYRLIDTAGIRRRGKVQRSVERFSVVGARRNIEMCDVAVLVLDGTEELAAQDAHIAGYIVDALKPMVVAVNKWDLVEDREAYAKTWEERVRFRLRFAKEVPILLLSAKTGQRVARVLDHVDELHRQGAIRVPTPALNRWLEEVGARGVAGKGIRLFYATQTGTRPPRFALFCNDPKLVHFSFRRHLENTLRDRFGFGAAPILLQFRHRRER